jgi:Flp pilus assembly protein TadG
MVTAELAVGLPALALVVLAAISAVALVTAQLRCTDAAAAAARLASRGESTTQIRSAALPGLPGAAGLDIVTTADTVTATVRTSVSPPGVLGFLPSVTIQAHVVEAREPTALQLSP